MNYLNISDTKLIPVIGELNLLLADYSIYYQKLRSFHWNVLSENFFDLHDKLEELYTDARLKIDEIAERVLTLRYHPVSNYSKYLETSSIKEVSPLITDVEMISEILGDHQKLLEQMKATMANAEKAGDKETIAMLGSYTANLEKLSWMLDAWRKNTEDQLNTKSIEKVY
ncbi:DNA starvation/stationary phase protection protein [Cellulophaga sp. F20128]|uniref:Dps family protein n=1 Tax=Cellulophaga sp. F20128 TaxID=2926413 RepID=UPI001FF1B0AD|nr:DNA starvation/stationary phase protection protein [Cellulophaga sp. F20128]MCK0155829.1 DNA starvation/stationary phase protection protein [Cellulophaga sp. F20128]